MCDATLIVLMHNAFQAICYAVGGSASQAKLMSPLVRRRHRAARNRAVSLS